MGANHEESKQRMRFDLILQEASIISKILEVVEKELLKLEGKLNASEQAWVHASAFARASNSDHNANDTTINRVECLIRFLEILRRHGIILHITSGGTNSLLTTSVVDAASHHFQV
ncbi:hypothetical protein Tco_0305074 [Tanacetum coccineum]